MPSFLRRGEPKETYVCEKTGLRLVRAPTSPILRIAKPSYGPLNPLVRQGADRGEWGRWDVEKHRTIYGAHPDESAFAESLATQRVANSISGKTLGELFSDVSGRGGLSSLLDVVSAEWAERHHMAPQHVAAAWRLERLQYELVLPSRGWFVDIESAESISAVSAGTASFLVERGKLQLTIGDLKSEDRDLTTRLAGWVRGQVLDDGTLPHGIFYSSKHSNHWDCWAIWLRALDDGQPVTSEPTKASEGTEIKPCNENAALDAVAKLFNLQVH